MYAIAFFISGFLELHLNVSDICVILSDTVKAIKSADDLEPGTFIYDSNYGEPILDKRKH